MWGEEPERFARLGEKTWGVNRDGMSTEEAALEGIRRCEAYFHSIGMPTRLCELGIDSAHLHEMAVKATYFGRRTLGSFKVLQEADIEAIYQTALK